MEYWFLYKITTGEIYGAPYLGSTEEWTNIPEGCEVVGPIKTDDTSAKEAYSYPNYYTVKNGKLTPVSNIEALRAADRAPKLIPVDPRDEKIARLESLVSMMDSQLKTQAKTIDFLLGV